eukprot:COSAG05_NODE_3620_length_1955_cov_4.852970_1_plen_437_part_10
MLAIGNYMVENSQSDSWAETGFFMQGLSTQTRMLRLLRLVRLAKLKDYLNTEKLVGQLHSALKRFGVMRLTLEFQFQVVYLVMIMLSGSHFLGCIWLLIGRHNVLELEHPTGWMVDLYAQWSCHYDSIHLIDTGFNNTEGTIEHECPIDINRTRDFVACYAADFDAAGWNEIHGWSCSEKCVPIPALAPHNVDCSWIRPRDSDADGTGDATGVGAHEHQQYLDGVYFAIVSISTVGYGDINPTTPDEKRFVIGAIMLGAFMYAYIIGNFSNLLLNMQREKSEFDAKMRSINDMLGFIDATEGLRNKVQDYYDYKYQNKEGPTGIFNELPNQMKTSLIKERYQELIQKVPFFSEDVLNDKLLVEICLKLKPFTVAPNDYVMIKGDQHDDLLILSQGEARTSTSSSSGDQMEVTLFEAGAFWGELQFLGLEERRTLDVT